MSDNFFIDLTIELAREAYSQGEMPVGAVVVDENKNIIAKAHNMVEQLSDPTAHAEILAIKQACEILNDKFLKNCDIYVSLEPCPMCASAISLARFRRLYFGSYNTKGGGVDNGAKIFNASSCNHSPEIYGGISEKESAQLLQDFFKNKR